MYPFIAFIAIIIVIALIRESNGNKAKAREAALRRIQSPFCDAEERARLMAYHNIKASKRGLAPR